MNQFKKTETPREAPKKKKAQNPSLVKMLRFVNVFGFLNKELLLSVLPFLLFMMFIGILYIANNYQAEKTIREIDQLNKELKALRTDYIIGKSELMFLCNQSEVARMVEPHGLKESVEAPVKIPVSTTTDKKKKS